MYHTYRCLVRFQPYAMAIQTRFKWRHKETDRWRRLMDATCFQLDWMGQTRGPNFSQYSGHWTHILSCAHVVCPWDYPNYYPTTGPTRFVSHITLADTMTQVRLVSLQGVAVHKHFTSNQHVYLHSNPRLDLCVVHPEQNLKRSGEMKMLWMQNEGLVMRPRLELNEALRIGDHVWVYGMAAHESLFDEENGPEPLMIPTGIRARVHAVTREHFFIDTTSIEGADRGRIQMGMCGSVVMRNGKCVGMLTAMVHEESNCAELAGTAMCTYSSDIFDFILEVEKQMKNPPPRQTPEETVFEARRREEGKEPETYRDWELDHSRIARHIPVPISLWHMEEKWMTEEDFMTSQVFGRSGVFNQETQESTLGYDMNTAKTYGDRPGDIATFDTTSATGRPVISGERKDYSPTGIYAPDEEFKRRDEWDVSLNAEVRSLFDKVIDEKEIESLNMYRKSLENIRLQRAMESMKGSGIKYPGGNTGEASEGGLGSMGHFNGDADMGPANFNPAYFSSAHEAERREGGNTQEKAPPGASQSETTTTPERQETPLEKKKRKRREEEAKLHEFRRQHGQKATHFLDEDFSDIWK
ncbi:unnamed protein product [Phytomonas sp. Hart1]|nr:unnamed protein product [Phytomonas sp. Hart1]|eukprot:CCW69404.1 unnamed protein product [Phytomonas sp. isolate Hart1]